MPRNIRNRLYMTVTMGEWKEKNMRWKFKDLHPLLRKSRTELGKYDVYLPEEEYAWLKYQA